MRDVDDVIAPILSHLKEHDPGEVLGFYLYGSATTTGLRPDSDLDCLVLTSRSLTSAERAEWVSLLLPLSGWSGHRQSFTEAAGRRPVELTSLVVSDLTALGVHPTCDFQYGEWNREHLVQGELPQPTPDPDVVSIIATAHSSHRRLLGSDLDALVPPPSARTLREATLLALPDLLAGIAGDERNVLLTLARMLVTLETHRIASKDEAADLIAPTLSPADRALLEKARDGYRGTIADAWDNETDQVSTLAHELAERARQVG